MLLCLMHPRAGYFTSGRGPEKCLRALDRSERGVKRERVSEMEGSLVFGFLTELQREFSLIHNWSGSSVTHSWSSAVCEDEHSWYRVCVRKRGSEQPSRRAQMTGNHSRQTSGWQQQEINDRKGDFLKSQMTLLSKQICQHITKRTSQNNFQILKIYLPTISL